jgi:hypothetical protein
VPAAAPPAPPGHEAGYTTLLPASLLARLLNEVCPAPYHYAPSTELSAKELKALEYILLCNIGKDFPPPTALNSNLDNRNLAHKVGVYAQMTNRELLVRVVVVAAAAAVVMVMAD